MRSTTPRRARAALCTLALLAAGCVTVSRPDGTRVASLGKGCIFADAEATIAESDGVSVNLASVFRGLGEIVGAVFGGTREPAPGLEQGEGCRGVLDKVYGDRASATSDAPELRGEVLELPPDISPEDAAALRELVESIGRR